MEANCKIAIFIYLLIKQWKIQKAINESRNGSYKWNHEPVELSLEGWKTEEVTAEQDTGCATSGESTKNR